MSVRPAYAVSAGAARFVDPDSRGRGGDPELVSRAHPERLLACLDPRLSAATVRRLQDCRRLLARLHDLLVRRYGALLAPPGAPSVDHAEDARLAGASPELGEAGDAGLAEAAILGHPDLMEVARLAGAVWHARSLKLLVSGPAVAEVVSRIGRRAHAFGLRNAAAAVASTPASDPVALAGAIERDGLLCLGAGLLAGSPALRLRVLLRLPPGTPAEAESFEEVVLRNAPAVLARVAAELQGPSHVA